MRNIVGLQRRHTPHNRYLQDLLQQGYVGKVRSVRIHVSMNYFQALRPNALRWTVPVENFSSVISIYAGHFLDMLFTAIGWPVNVSGLIVNQFDTVTIKETAERLSSSAPDQMVIAGQLEDGALLSVHIEGGKRNGSGVLPVPASYLRLPPSDLPSSVLELAELYHVYAQDLAEGTHAAATFDDAVRMHTLLDGVLASSQTGRRTLLAQ